jgi:hypothetical protein
VVKQALEATGPAVLVPFAPAAPVGVSVIVPVSERPEPLDELYQEYAAPLRAAGRSYEFVFVAEPYFDGLTAPLHELASRGEPIRVLVVGQAVGEAALLKLAADQCRAPIVVTLPSYRRVDAAAILPLIERVEGGADLVVARRWPRRDGWINQAQNRAFHALLRFTARGTLHDIASGVRAMRREVLQEIPLYGDFFRFLPLLALREGYQVEEVDAAQHPRDIRRRFYGPGVYLRRLLDVFGLYFLLRFTEKPLRFFGLLGSVLSLVGGLLLLVLLVQRIEGVGIANRPLLLLGVLLVVLGVQAVALGLIGEIIVHLHAPHRRPYRLMPEPRSQGRPTGGAEPSLPRAREAPPAAGK